MTGIGPAVVVSHDDSGIQARKAVFARLRERVAQHLVLLEVTSPRLAARGHRSWVWDATRLPTGSHYVPVFLDILENMESRGEISPQTHILVETTTGNAGAAAAYLARELGYSIIVFMPEDMPRARIEDVRSYLSDGSELRLTPAGRYVEGMVTAFREFLVIHREGYGGRRLLAVNHSRRPESTGAITREVQTLLNRQLPDGVVIDTAVVALGNGTTATGVGRAIKRHNPQATVVGIEPLESPWFYTRKYGSELFRKVYGAEPRFHSHGLIGAGGWGVSFPNMELNLLDSIVLVTESEWSAALTDMNGRGFHAGHTSAACLSVIEKLSLLHEDRAMRFFSMFYDPPWKY